MTRSAIRRLSLVGLSLLMAILVWGQRPSIAQAQTEKRAPQAASAPFTGYLMVYFGPEEKLFYALSRDARHWTALNSGKPVFDPGVRLRDPFLNRVNGVFHLVHTKAWDTPIIFHWESTDLVHWKGVPITVVAPEQKRAWAPEFLYEPTAKLFYVFWASEYKGHNTIFYQTTHDWTDMTPARSAVYYDLGIDDIDIDVIEHKGTYYAFHKPGTVEDRMGNRLTTSRSLDPAIDRFGKEGASRDVLPNATKPIEGPEAIKLIGEDRWYVHGDPFHAPMEAWETKDFVTFTKIDVDTPRGSKHPGLMPITEAEWKRLQAAYP